MSNIQKCREKYGLFIADLEAFLAGDRKPTLEANLDRVWRIQDTQPQFEPPIRERISEYAARVCKDIVELAQLRARRSNRIINETEMEMSSETDAFYELQSIRTIFEDLVFPTRTSCNGTNSEFVQSMLKELFNLSLAYSHSVVQASADEFVPEENVYAAKTGATTVAREAFDFKQAFTAGRESGNPALAREQFERFHRALQSHASPAYLRDFKLTFVAPKSIYKKEECIRSLVQQVVADEQYAPGFLVPVAQGGIELAVRFDSAYRAHGHEPTSYPIMFSIKTRKHRRPWTDLDGEFFGKIPGESLLVTEDWITTGTTIKGVLADIVSSLPGQVRFATIKRDPRSMKDALLRNQWIYSGMVSAYGGNKTDEVKPGDSGGFDNDC